MNKALLHNVIKTLLEKMSEQNKMLSQHKGQFSQIETDLLRKHCLELYEAIGQLNLLNSNAAHINLVPPMEVENENHNEKQTSAQAILDDNTESEPLSIQEEEPELIIANIPEITAEQETEAEPELEKVIQEPVIHEPVEVVPEIITKKEEVVITEQPPLEPIREESSPRFIPVKKQTPQVVDTIITEEPLVVEQPVIENSKPQFIPIEEKPAPVYIPPAKSINPEKSVLDKISHEQKTKTIHDHISSKNEEKLLHDTFPNSKIASIPSAIDISKRFEIQNNLFGGQSQTYSQAIRSLEDAGDKKTALEVFESFVTRLNWDTDSELLKEFKSLIYRRY